jgi:hypothetical protein
MPHFTINTDADGKVIQILKDGQPYNEAVRLEQLFAIVSTYFRIADNNLNAMQSVAKSEMLRFYGLQAFVMALTGVEAFTNVYFQLRGIEQKRPTLIAKAAERGPLRPRLIVLIEMAFGAPLKQQELILAKVRELYRLRNEIVHPRWIPSSVSLNGEINLEGLVQNFQAIFEDRRFCIEALTWCRLLVSRIALAAGVVDTGGFIFHWTGLYGVNDAGLSAALNLPAAI